jgi:hypothetical protein
MALEMVAVIYDRNHGDIRCNNSKKRGEKEEGKLAPS